MSCNRCSGFIRSAIKTVTHASHLAWKHRTEGGQPSVYEVASGLVFGVAALQYGSWVDIYTSEQVSWHACCNENGKQEICAVESTRHIKRSL